jgi:hypothetical protein
MAESALRLDLQLQELEQQRTLLQLRFGQVEQGEAQVVGSEQVMVLQQEGPEGLLCWLPSLGQAQLRLDKMELLEQLRQILEFRVLEELGADHLQLPILDPEGLEDVHLEEEEELHLLMAFYLGLEEMAEMAL